MLRLAAASLLLLLTPAGASAAGVGYYPGSPTEGKVPGTSPSLSFRADPGEANAVSVTAVGMDLVFRDAGAPLAPIGPGLCSALGPQEVRCPRAAVLDVVLLDGNDTLALQGQTGVSRLDAFGGDGNDTLAGPQLAAPGVDFERSDLLVLAGGAGNDTLQGGDGPETLDGGEGDDVVRGGQAADVLRGGAGRDALFGEAGDDGLQGDPRDVPAAADALDGGPGRDRAFWDTTESVRVDLADPEPDGRVGEGDRLATVEDVVGGRGANALFGDAGPNRLTGRGSGPQELRGGGGNDVLVARSSASDSADGVLLDGGAGDDVLDGDFQPRCGGGRDVIPVSDVVRDCERVQLDGVTLGLKPLVRGGRVLLDVRREQTVITSRYGPKRRNLQLLRGFNDLLLAQRRLTFPRPGIVRLPLTRTGRALLRRGPTLVVLDDIRLLLVMG